MGLRKNTGRSNVTRRENKFICFRIKNLTLRIMGVQTRPNKPRTYFPGA